MGKQSRAKRERRLAGPDRHLPDAAAPITTVTRAEVAAAAAFWAESGSDPSYEHHVSWSGATEAA